MLVQAHARQHAKQGVISGVLKTQGSHSLTLEIGRTVDPAIGTSRQQHQGTTSQHRHGLDWNPVRPHDHGGVANSTTDDCVARAHLLGNVNSASGGLERDIQSLLVVVAQVLGQHPRAEGRQEGWSG